MTCPKCYKAQTVVIDSRAKNDPIYIRRRRKCNECGYSFITIEMFIRETRRWNNKGRCSYDAEADC